MNPLQSGNSSNVREDNPGLFELSFSQQAFTVGDIVTRTGDDEQVITSIDFDWETLEVLCIKPALWIGFGEDESNLIRRYDFVRSAAEHSVQACPPDWVCKNCDAPNPPINTICWHCNESACR